jgi:hypothetical protein
MNIWYLCNNHYEVLWSFGIVLYVLVVLPRKFWQPWSRFWTAFRWVTCRVSSASSRRWVHRRSSTRAGPVRTAASTRVSSPSTSASPRAASRSLRGWRKEQVSVICWLPGGKGPKILNLGVCAAISERYSRWLPGFRIIMIAPGLMSTSLSAMMGWSMWWWMASLKPSPRCGENP